MKSEIKEVPKVSNKPFPKLMKIKVNKFSKEKVIIFAWFGLSSSNLMSGVVIHSDSKNYAIGYNSNAWNLAIFEDYDGEITLSND